MIGDRSVSVKRCALQILAGIHGASPIDCIVTLDQAGAALGPTSSRFIERSE
jgi:hypothetical protein